MATIGTRWIGSEPSGGTAVNIYTQGVDDAACPGNVFNSHTPSRQDLLGWAEDWRSGITTARNSQTAIASSAAPITSCRK